MAGYGYATKGYTTYDEIQPPKYQGYICEDHVCRPVLVDAEGRKSPIINYTTNSPAYVRKTPDYTYVKEVRHVHTPTPEYTSNEYGSTNNGNWRRQSISPPREYHDEFITTKVHPAEVTHSPTKTTTTNYWQTTTPTPTYGWTTKPKSHQLTTTTNDIGEAVDFLRHAINEAEGNQPHAQPWVQKRESYVAETIDSREAARRYAMPPFKPQPSHETYMGNIDSREAVRRYNGTIVP